MVTGIFVRVVGSWLELSSEINDVAVLMCLFWSLNDLQDGFHQLKTLTQDVQALKIRVEFGRVRKTSETIFWFLRVFHFQSFGPESYLLWHGIFSWKQSKEILNTSVTVSPCPGFAGKVDRIIFNVSCSTGVTVCSHILMGFLFS